MADIPEPPDSGAPAARPFADLQAELENLELPGPGGAQLPKAPPPITTVASEAARINDEVAAAAAAAPEASAAAPVSDGQRLCPGCNGVHEFVDGRCLNCGYQLTADTPRGEDAALLLGEAYSYREPGSPVMLKVALVLLLLALIGIAAWFAWPLLHPVERKATDASTDVQAAKAADERKAAAGAAFVGSVKPVTIDDALKLRVSSTMRAGNAAWQDAGVKAYVYRYTIKEQAQANVSQSLRITAYAAGPDVKNAVSNKDALFTAAAKPLMDDLNGNPGVTATLEVEDARDVSFAPGDVYVLYGADYGRDHLDGDIQPIIDALENYKHDNKQYPIALDESVAGSGVRTKGNPNFAADGFGYIPIFKTDSAGNILMGSGSGVERLEPAEVEGYYLLRFLPKLNDGLDIYSPADLNYYTQKISPFPYSPSQPVHNMPMHKDGKPDGVGAVIKNGKLQ